jgi:hypothetical protein
VPEHDVPDTHPEVNIEHAALAGIASASNAVESDDFRSPAVGWIPGLGAVGVATCPHAFPTPATRITEYNFTEG